MRSLETVSPIADHVIHLGIEVFLESAIPVGRCLDYINNVL